MADGTIIQQGSFTSTGVNETLQLRSDVDWIRVYNYTQMAATNNGYGYEYHWQDGMTTNGMIYYHPAGDHTSAINIGANLFLKVDSSAQTLSAPVAITAGTDATQPVYSTGSTAGLADGDIVRISGTDHTDIDGLDFTIDTVVANTSFRLANTLQQSPGVVAGAAGYWRKVNYDPVFYPKRRAISNITQANPGVVTTLVDHGLTTGQKVRLKVSADNGMIELNNVAVTVTAIDASTFSIGVDTTANTAFTYPLPAAVPFTSAEVIPFGEEASSTYVNNLDDATINEAYIGIRLTGGTVGPAGNNNDVVYWVAGKSFNI